MKHRKCQTIISTLAICLALASRLGQALEPQQTQAPLDTNDQRGLGAPNLAAPGPRAAADVPAAQPPVTVAAAAQPVQPVAITTPSPFKLPTVIPELDFNKDLLDYDNDLLASLKFYPTTADLNLAALANKSTAPPTTAEAYEKWLVNRYHDHDQLHAYLLQLAQAYPQVARLYEVGQSVEGRKLWALEISESPGRHEPLKPEFRYLANMHGNEVVGRQLLLHLARLILENYHREEPASDANRPTGVKFIKKLVKATRIHLMPTMNPDGFARSDVGCKYEPASQKGRLNANNVDLNRNFPDKVLGTQADAGTQPEVRAVMDWSRREPFVLSANLHGGHVAAIVPYDSGTSPSSLANVSAGWTAVEQRPSPDHATYLELARAYTRSHPTMWRGEMCYDKCTEYHPEVFPNDGITNGAGWFVAYGSMQDWMYDNTNDFHITLEIGCNQYPPTEALHQYWQFNKAPLLNYMRQVHRGIKGMIEDEVSARPLAGVRVHVHKIDHDVVSTQAGDYFRLLAPGSYQVAFEHADYHPVEIFVTVRSAMAQIHSIKMRPRNVTTQGLATTGAGSNTASPSTTDTITTLDGDLPAAEPSGSSSKPQPLSPEENQHAIAVATLVMTVVIILLLVLLAGAYVVQKRRFSRSQSVSVELQPSGRSAAGAGSTGISLPPLPTASSLKSGGGGVGGGSTGGTGGVGGGGRSSLSPHVA